MKQTRVVHISEGLSIGGGAPISVQTMWKQPLVGVDLDPVVEQINQLYLSGCDLIRFSVPTSAEGDALIQLNRKSPIPLVADIHFDYRLALQTIMGGIPKVRINPGNIGDSSKVEEVIRAALGEGTAIRVGVNGGSLPAQLRNHSDPAEAMVLAAEMEMEILEKLNFNQVIFSLKSSNVTTTCEANKRFATRYDYPLHLGVTEAGPLEQGIAKSGVAMGILLSQGIGDTIRVSLSAPMEKEVESGNHILHALGLRSQGVEIISCPQCGRSTFEVRSFLERIVPHIRTIQKPIKVAVMGCIVNGPNEAKGADIGITGSSSGVVIFSKGKQVKATTPDEGEQLFLELLNTL